MEVLIKKVQKIMKEEEIKLLHEEEKNQK